MYVVAAIGMAFYVHHDEMNDMKDVHGMYTNLGQSSAMWICIAPHSKNQEMGSTTNLP